MLPVSKCCPTLSDYETFCTFRNRALVLELRKKLQNRDQVLVIRLLTIKGGTPFFPNTRSRPCNLVGEAVSVLAFMSPELFLPNLYMP